MGVPGEACGFYRELYRDCAAVINFPGTTGMEFSVGRGARQGHHAMMLLFACALDPVLRWMRAKLTDHVPWIRAYVDDISFCLPNILTDLQPTLLLLRKLEHAVGLGLNIPKCKVLVFGSLDPDRLVAHLRAKGSE
eukprot:8915804-Pyramimonas_sp.AAC.1